MKHRQLSNETLQSLYRDDDSCPDAPHFVDVDARVREFVHQYNGVKTSVFPRVSLSNELDKIRFSAVMSDITSAYLWADSMSQVMFEKPRPPFPSKFRLPIDVFDEGGEFEDVEFIEGNPNIHFTYWFADVKYAPTQRFVAECAPLAESGRLFFRGSPKMLLGTKERNDEGGRVWRTVDFIPDTPSEKWVVQLSDNEQSSIPLTEASSTDSEGFHLSSFCMPYIRNISIKDLAKILDDEHHLLADFRLSLRKMTQEVKEAPQDSTEIHSDIVRPTIDRVERRFKSIVTQGKLKVAGVAVGTISLGLVGLLDGGLAGTAGKLLGSSGLGVILKEYSDYQKARDELREMPLYLLWKFRRESGQ